MPLGFCLRLWLLDAVGGRRRGEPSRGVSSRNRQAERKRRPSSGTVGGRSRQAKCRVDDMCGGKQGIKKDNLFFLL